MATPTNHDRASLEAERERLKVAALGKPRKVKATAATAAILADPSTVDLKTITTANVAARDRQNVLDAAMLAYEAGAWRALARLTRRSRAVLELVAFEVKWCGRPANERDRRPGELPAPPLMR